MPIWRFRARTLGKSQFPIISSHRGSRSPDNQGAAVAADRPWGLALPQYTQRRLFVLRLRVEVDIGQLLGPNFNVARQVNISPKIWGAPKP